MGPLETLAGVLGVTGPIMFGEGVIDFFLDGRIAAEM